MGIKQHLMGLQWVGPQHKGTTVAELEVGNLVRSPPMTTHSSDQSNWKASPGAKTSGTNVPLVADNLASCWRDRQSRAKAATRS